MLAEAVPAPTPKPEWLEANVLLIRDLMHPVAVAQFQEDATKATGWRAGDIYKLSAGAYNIVQVADVPRVSGTWDDAVLAVRTHALHVYAAGSEHFAGIVKKDQGYAFLRFETGAKYGQHIDGAPGHPEPQIAVRVAAFHLYLGEDYEGGELVLPRQKLVIKPSIGSVVIFPTGFAYPHESRVISRGRKDVVVSWLR